MSGMMDGEWKRVRFKGNIGWPIEKPSSNFCLHKHLLEDCTSHLLLHQSIKMISTNIFGRKLTRDEWEKETLHKPGTEEEADKDGQPVNPHVPEYIARAPWYVDSGAGSLNHQRNASEDHSAAKLEQWYDRGATAGPAAKKYRKGACENCGAMTHKRQDCVERPRRRGAKFTNKDIRADERIQQMHADYDAKRDRWNGYDPTAFKGIMDEYEATEAARAKKREEEIDQQTSTDMSGVKKVAKAKKEGDDEFGSSDEDDEDDDKYAEAADQVGQKIDTANRVSVRNLRIREDTAKYLLNLNPESAYYDPKTRSMRDAPYEGMAAEDVGWSLFISYGG